MATNILFGNILAISTTEFGYVGGFALLILPAATEQHPTARAFRAIVLAAVLGVLCIWIGLFIGFYLPVPPSFFITALAFVTYVTVRTFVPGVGSTRPRSARGALQIGVTSGRNIDR